MGVGGTEVLIDAQRFGKHRQAPPDGLSTSVRRRRARAIAVIAVVGVGVMIFASVMAYNIGRPPHARQSTLQRTRQTLPTTPGSYIGLYSHEAPQSYEGVKAFTSATGVKPRVVAYYSGWPEPFQVDFATTAASENAVPLVQMDPSHVSIAAIAAGSYDSYLETYAKAIRGYKHPVILSFGHEMNGYWYSWGYTHTSPNEFVAAWRHIVTLFRTLGAQNVTWLWTINTIHPKTRVPSPGPWWPGSQYVNWVGVDGYYINQSSVFASVFGPTVVYLRSLTNDPILISETSATPVASQPAKITDLFAGIRLYGLLGFVWFDSIDKIDWRLSTPEALAVFGRDAKAYSGPAA